jgi:hypothetical protein
VERRRLVAGQRGQALSSNLQVLITRMGFQVVPCLEMIMGAIDIESLRQLLYQKKGELELTKLAYDMVVKAEK